MKDFCKVILSDINKVWVKIKGYINNLSIVETLLTMLTTVFFITFHYLLNAVTEKLSDIISFSFLFYLLVCIVVFAVRKKIPFVILHIIVMLVSLYSIFWFVFTEGGFLK